MRRRPPGITSKKRGTGDIAADRAKRAPHSLKDIPSRASNASLRLKAERFMEVVDNEKNTTPLQRFYEFNKLIQEERFVQNLSEYQVRFMALLKSEHPEKKLV